MAKLALESIEKNTTTIGAIIEESEKVRPGTITICITAQPYFFYFQDSFSPSFVLRTSRFSPCTGLQSFFKSFVLALSRRDADVLQARLEVEKLGRELAHAEEQFPGWNIG